MPIPIVLPPKDTSLVQALVDELGPVALRPTAERPTDEPFLHLDDDHLTLIHPQGAFSPLSIDWVGGRSGHRRRQGSFAGGVLARAVKIGRRPTVVDATAGLGKDAIVLAALGCTVTLIERQPALQALLWDAHRRLAEHDPELAGRLQVVAADALTWRPDGWTPEVVHLDPMFPERRKSALVKQDMRWLQAMCGSDPDAPTLLAHALSLGARRVVVKRPDGAPPLAGPRPHHRLDGGQVGYDVYLA